MSCHKCPLHKTCKSIQIWGRGEKKHPAYMFVGQAPGQEEDDQNKCFVGPAGQLLSDAIKEYDLYPNYLTNVVKCFPPNDRKPLKGEIDKCKYYLFKEIETVKPKMIVAVGAIPLQVLTGRKGISDYAGRVVAEWRGIPVFSIYHPSFILRSP